MKTFLSTFVLALLTGCTPTTPVEVKPFLPPNSENIENKGNGWFTFEYTDDGTRYKMLYRIRKPESQTATEVIVKLSEKKIKAEDE